jgi:photosystem II stability/assembly factor-like uncharacterized protein
MKKTLLFAFLLIGLRMILAQEGWQWQNPQPQGNSLYDVSFTSADTGTAVGVLGTIIRTTDGGTTWTCQTGNTTNTLRGVCFTDAKTGIAVGDSGIIIRTINGGVTWTSQSSGVSYNLNGVSFSDPQTGTAVGNHGVILHTTDGGTNWLPQTSGTTVALYSVSLSGANKGTVVGQSGSIFLTTDGGMNWMNKTGITTRSLYGVCYTDADTGIAVGNGGTIVRTTDGGANWAKATSGISKDLRRVCLCAGQILTAVGIEGTILRSTDGGVDWTKQTLADSSTTLWGASFVDDNIGTVVGDNGSIYSTINGGETWTGQVINRTYENLWHIKAVNDNVVWASGENGTVLRTINGGESWTLTTPTQVSYVNLCLAPIDMDTAWITGNNFLTTDSIIESKIWKTVDGGNSWTEKYFSQNKCSEIIHFFDSNNGVYIADPQPFTSQWEILTTENGGDSWNPIPAGNCPPADSTYNEQGLAFAYDAHGDIIWFSTSYGVDNPGHLHIYRSVDKGYTWTAFDLPYIGADWVIFSFCSATNGLACSYYSGNLAQTSDGGATWSIIDTLGMGTDYLKSIPGKLGTFLLAGDGGKFMFSNDYGNSWNPSYTGTTKYFNRIETTATNVWAVGENGIILHTTTATFTSVRDHKSDTPQHYSLNQNYPNPFNPVTTISFTLPQTEFTTLKIYDLLGREITTIVSQKLVPGIHTYQFNASNLASGVYYYQIVAGKFRQVKKMVLLK